MSCFSRLAALALFLLAAACGPVPTPFKQAAPERAANPLLALPDSVGVTVAPAQAGPPALTGPLADRTAERLRWAGVPASSGPALTGGYLLEGAVDWRAGAAAYDWRLSDPAGETVEAGRVEADADRAAFDAGDDAVIAALAAEASAAVARALTPPSLRAAAAADRGAPRPDAVHVMEVEGPAARPARELQRALAALLDDLGAPLTDDAAEATLLIQGRLEASRTQNANAGASTPVTIEWWLLDADGAVVGSLVQNNAAPGDPVRDGFGPLAYDIAYPVADAVARSLQR